SVPDRLKLQIDYMQMYDLDMVGSDLILINESGKTIGYRKYPKGNEIRKMMPFKNPFAHNTILIKRQVLLDARGYNSGFNSEDYDLWLRLKRMEIKWDNIDSPLVEYRIHSCATQRRLLGYAESTALAMREFILDKSFTKFFAILYHLIKSFFRAKKI
ncbi:MAG: glycosyltransferase, partial [Vibrio sp.]